ncbi:IclR family transcriptional regulator [Arthrobacter crystallopoietes BAB-32]|uniref:IclR family transcriptional regulator n=1 Tax=Arthrobacter crystallopoietes BAB-32 TaxID=1246476 RepID=N1V0N3_9MICC|nr:helix-turn-helix domain-containing protein [Arthrobacter crystallopoietes]EMY34860.1 IclR family transcriptional regulator [Arthrobacter crystallopoietes BAB-32]
MSIVDAVEFAPMTATDLAQLLDMNLSTVHRLATALTQHGLLSRGTDGRYGPGVRFGMSNIAWASRPLLTQLRDETSETAQLWVRRGDSRLCLESVEATQELRVTLPAGWTLPLSDGGSAAFILLDRPTRREDGTDPGWLETVSQRTVGLGSVSAAVRVGNKVVAAVCLAMPLPRVQTSPGQQWGDRVVAIAGELASRLNR